MADTAVPPIALPTPSAGAVLAPSAQPGSNLETSFSGLDAIAKEPSNKADVIPDGPAAPKKPVDKKVEAKEPPKPKEEAKVEETPEPKEEPPVEPKDAAKPGEPAKVKRPGDFLREENARLKAERDTFKAEAEKLKAAPSNDPEKLELKTKFESTQKQVEEYENKLRLLAYEQSKEYGEKYLKPFQDAVALGRNKIKALDVILGTDEATGEVKTRPATEEDFDRVMLQPDDRIARQEAKKLFGEDYMVAIHHREKVMEMNTARRNAMEDYKIKGAELEKQARDLQSTQQKQMQETQMKLRENHFESFKERYPEAITVDAEDKDAENILSQDRGATDILFKENNLPREKLLQLHGEMRNRAAHFGLLNHKFKVLQKQFAEAQEKLKQFEASDPGEGTGVKTKGEPSTPDNMAGVMAELDRRGKPAAGNYF